MSYRKDSSKQYGKKKPKSQKVRTKSKLIVLKKKPSRKTRQAQKAVVSAQTKATSTQARRFPGFKAKLHFNLANLAISTDVRYAKMERKDLIPKIIMRDDKGREVEYRPDRKYKFAYFVKNTNERLDEKDVRFYQVINGKEIQVSKFERTSDIKIEKLLPMTELELFLPESFYELWGDNPESLFRIADYLDKTDQVGVAKVSLARGLRSQKYAIIYPTRFGDEFVLTMMLTSGRKIHQHRMPMASKANEYKETQQKVVGTLEEL